MEKKNIFFCVAKKRETAKDENILSAEKKNNGEGGIYLEEENLWSRQCMYAGLRKEHEL